MSASSSKTSSYKMPIGEFFAQASKEDMRALYEDVLDGANARQQQVIDRAKAMDADERQRRADGRKA